MVSTPSKHTRPAAPRARREVRSAPRKTDAQLLAHGISVVQAEARAIGLLEERMNAAFVKTVRLIMRCQGHVVVTGMGKPGFVAQKISATLASTGVPSLYLHPAEALHGDLGRVGRRDVALVLSNSGRTEEIVRLLGPMKALGVTVVAITGDVKSPLARHADVVLDIGPVVEACPLGLAPTASSTAMLVLGDALAMTVSDARQFSKEDFARYHPAGKLGRQLMKVSEVMRQDQENPRVTVHASLREAVEVMTRTPGRPGATHVVDDAGRLVGLLTDGDLRRFLLESQGTPDMRVKVEELMARHPKTVRPEQLVEEALRVLTENQVDQVPVVDGEHRPVGLLDVQDLLAVRRV
ncbi:MAG: KpsF/GutQ family sugar-phosphate isomerase [Myxococcota bacterium]